MDNIASWSQAELRRFIVNTILSDPGAMPPSPLPPGALDGDVPVWDAASKTWRASTGKPVEGRMLQLHDGTVPPQQPRQGDLWRYSDGGNFSWLFDYQPRMDPTYPWQFIGGAPWFVTNNSTTAQTSGGWNFADDGADPNVTLSFAGVWTVRWTAQLYMGSVAVSYSTIGAAIGLNGTASPVSTQSHDLKAFQNGRNGHSSLSNNYQATYAVNDNLKMSYYTDNFGPNIFERHLEVTPVRIAA